MITVIKYPAALDIPDKSKLQIEKVVENDLVAFCKTKFRKEISKSQLKAFKIHLILFFLFIL